jgi:chromosomal replication initiation ATPase DnaA
MKLNPHIYAGLDQNTREAYRLEAYLGQHLIGHIRSDSEAYLKRVVAGYFNITTTELVGASRKRYLVYARRVYCKLMRDFTLYSLTAIGNTINRDHATVIHALNEMRADIDTKQAPAPAYSFLRDQLITLIRQGKHQRYSDPGFEELELEITGAFV